MKPFQRYLPFRMGGIDRLRALWNKPIFYKYLSSYILILMIPMVLLGVVGYKQISKNLYEKIAVSHADTLDRMQENIESKLVEMNRISAQIGVDPELTPYAFSQGFYQAYLAKNILDYKAANHFIHQMLLYIRNKDMLYSAQSTYSLTTFNQEVYPFTHWNGKQFAADMNTSTKPIVRPVESVIGAVDETDRYLNYIVPIPFNSFNPTGTVLFLIKENTLHAMLNDKEMQRSKLGNTIIFDQAGNRITALKDASYLESPTFLGDLLKDGDNQLAVTMKIDNEQYIVSYVKSELTGWTYMMMIPRDEALSPVIEMKSRWFNSLILILFVGSVLIYVVMVLNYNPIRKLVQLAEYTWGKQSRQQNELETVRKVIHQMGESHSQLDRKWLESKDAVKEHVLYRLLSGQYEDRQAFNEEGEAIDVTLMKTYIGVVMVQFSTVGPELKRQLMNEFMGCLPSDYEGYGKDQVEPGKFVMLLGSEEISLSIDDWIQTMRHHIQQEHGIQMTVGIGKMYKTVGEVGISYIEAATALDYKFIRGNNTTIYFQDVAGDMMAGRWNFREEMAQLERLIKQGNTDKITEVINNIAASLEQKQTTLFAARCVCFDMINTVFGAMDDQSSLNTKQYPDILSIMTFDTVKELALLMNNLCADLCQAIVERAVPRSEQTIDNMKQYIHEHYSDYNFSVQQLANHFSLSMSYVSRIFKEQTQMNVSDFLNEVRIEQAKKMLKEGNDSLKDIVQQIGYSDSSSFIRKFKKQVGMTPGEYRKLYEE